MALKRVERLSKEAELQKLRDVMRDIRARNIEIEGGQQSPARYRAIDKFAAEQGLKATTGTRETTELKDPLKGIRSTELAAIRAATSDEELKAKITAEIAGRLDERQGQLEQAEAQTEVYRQNPNAPAGGGILPDLDPTNTAQLVEKHLHERQQNIRKYGEVTGQERQFPYTDPAGRFAQPGLVPPEPTDQTFYPGGGGRFATPELTGQERVPMLSEPAGSDTITGQEGTAHLPGGPVDDAIRSTVPRIPGFTEQHWRAIADIESGQKPNSNIDKPTQYKGLFQINNNELGGKGNIYDPLVNAQAAQRTAENNGAWFRGKFGRDATPKEVFMMHLQGRGFYSKGTMTNVPGNPYPGMKGPQTPATFEKGWGDAIDKRVVAFGGQPGQPAQAAPVKYGVDERAQPAGGAAASGKVWPFPNISVDKVPSDGLTPGSRNFMGIRGTGHHAGLDVPQPPGTQVLSPGEGNIVRMGFDKGGYGNFADLQLKDGTVHRFGHLSGFPEGTKVGLGVKPGQQIGISGYSGNAEAKFPHTHYEVFPSLQNYQNARGQPSHASANLRQDPRTYHQGSPSIAPAAAVTAPPGQQPATTAMASPITDERLAPGADQLKDESPTGTEPPPQITPTAPQPPSPIAAAQPLQVGGTGGIGSDANRPLALPQTDLGGPASAGIGSDLRVPTFETQAAGGGQGGIGSDYMFPVGQPDPAAASVASTGGGVDLSGGGGGGGGGLFGDFGLGGGKGGGGGKGFQNLVQLPQLPDLGQRLLQVADEKEERGPTSLSHIKLPAPPQPMMKTPQEMGDTYVGWLWRKQQGFA
jgi:Peptidase family M23